MRRLMAAIRLRRSPVYRRWRARKPVCERVAIHHSVAGGDGTYCPRDCADDECAAANEHDAWAAARPSERGSGGLGPVGAVLLTVVILAVVRVLFGVDLIGYLDAAADALVDAFEAFLAGLDSSTRH